jgi:hypothetical protein
MLLAPLTWILIARRRHWSYLRKGGVALIALVPEMSDAVVLSLVLNGLVALTGAR